MDALERNKTTAAQALAIEMGMPTVSFDICPAAYIYQWAEELTKHFKPVSVDKLMSNTLLLANKDQTESRWK